MTTSAQEHPTEFVTVVLLVDDQRIVAEAVGRMFAGERDIVFHYFSDPAAAIETATKVKPTVILQDLVMPEIDGMTLVRYHRAHNETRDIPLIVLSSKEEPKIKAESFAAGANDYLVKLPDKLELTARVRYHSRGYVALQQRNQAFQALAKELAEAAHYVQSLLPKPEEGPPRTNWIYVPSAQLGGDTFGYHWIDERYFAIYLLDVCGHGVGAALLSVSVMNVLRSQSLKDTDFLDPARVLSALNDAFPMESNNNMFFTIWYGVYDALERCLTYSSGGHPPALLCTGSTAGSAELKTLSTSGFLVGAMDGTTFENAMVQLDEWLEMLGAFSHEPSADLQQLLVQMQEIQGREHFDDDVSLLQVGF
jgi:sigma-B regulation protein RsbU (phosphoserine phosphatase)